MWRSGKKKKKSSQSITKLRKDSLSWSEFSQKKISSGLAATAQEKNKPKLILSLLRWDHLHSVMSFLMVLWSISTRFKEIILIFFSPSSGVFFVLSFSCLLSQFRDINRCVSLFLEPVQCSLSIQELMITVVKCYTNVKCQTIDIHYGDEAPHMEMIFSRWAFRIVTFRVSF